MDEHLVGDDAVQASARLNFGSEKDVKEASKQRMELRKNVMGCLRNGEKKPDDLQDDSSQRIISFRFEVTVILLEKCNGWLSGINWNLEWKRVHRKMTSSLSKPRFRTDCGFRGSLVVTYGCIFVLRSEHGCQCGFLEYSNEIYSSPFIVL